MFLSQICCQVMPINSTKYELNADTSNANLSTIIQIKFADYEQFVYWELIVI